MALLLCAGIGHPPGSDAANPSSCTIRKLPSHAMRAMSREKRTRQQIARRRSIRPGSPDPLPYTVGNETPAGNERRPLFLCVDGQQAGAKTRIASELALNSKRQTDASAPCEGRLQSRPSQYPRHHVQFAVIVPRSRDHVPTPATCSRPQVQLAYPRVNTRGVPAPHGRTVRVSPAWPAFKRPLEAPSGEKKKNNTGRRRSQACRSRPKSPTLPHSSHAARSATCRGAA